MMITQENIPYTADEIKAMVKTIEELRKKYNGALERASKLIVQNPFDTVGQMVEHIFPELLESEDEKIRKEIIAFLYSKNGYMTPNEDWDFHNRWLAWLEKQGEHKPYGQRKECEDCQFNYAGECKGYCALKRNEQTQFDYEHAYIPKKDFAPIEPKFKVGDWVVRQDGENFWNGNCVAQITNITERGEHWFDSGSWLKAKDIRLWTIQDAKDGDVLVTEDGRPFIIRCMVESENDIPSAYCGINARPSEAFVITGYSPGTSKWTNSKVHPATKEQRDLLFEKMKEAGYEWDQKEKKPIKMKETKFKVGDWIATDDSFGKIVRHVDEISSNIIDERYGVSDEYGLTYNISFDKEHKWHKWTIQDASDGDVLVNGSNIFIFHFINDTRLMGYCHVNLDDGRFYDDIGKNECFCLIDAVVTPATKEQRVLLFERMKEADYEWDAEKKVLSKRDMEILPEAKMQAYIKYCNDKFPSNIFCDKCGKAVIIEREYPYFYDKDENDVYFASICPECGELLITKE